MKPPYDITSKILNYITSISEKIGEVNANFLNKSSPQLRKQNKITKVSEMENLIKLGFMRHRNMN